MLRNKILSAVCLATLFSASQADALTLEKIKYGDFSQWVTRDITESKVLGGNTKRVYAVGPSKHITGNYPYHPEGGTPWASSNVYAKVSGVVKASNSVEPAVLNGNKVAKLQAKMEHVKVLGMINMDVMVAGTLYLGKLNEPVTSTSAPFSKMAMGMPYRKRPKALVYDFRIDMPNVNTRVKSTGLSRKKTLQGRDQAEVYVLLQYRWEDKNGNVYAHRVGTGRERYSKSIPWTVGHQLPIHYGDITKKPFYKPWMGLLNGDKAYYGYNSKGKLVPVKEVGWAPEGTQPTHVLVMASTSCGEPFVGTEGLTMYIDNIAFGF